MKTQFQTDPPTRLPTGQPISVSDTALFDNLLGKNERDGKLSAGLVMVTQRALSSASDSC